MLDDGEVLWLIEAKSGRTVAGDWFRPLRAAVERTAEAYPHKDVRGVIVYGGDEPSSRHGIAVVACSGLDALAPPA